MCDHGGLMSLPGLPESRFVVNILGCGHSVQSSVLPDDYADANVCINITLDFYSLIC